MYMYMMIYCEYHDDQLVIKKPSMISDPLRPWILYKWIKLGWSIQG